MIRIQTGKDFKQTSNGLVSMGGFFSKQWNAYKYFCQNIFILCKDYHQIKANPQDKFAGVIKVTQTMHKQYQNLCHAIDNLFAQISSLSNSKGVYESYMRKFLQISSPKEIKPSQKLISVAQQNRFTCFRRQVERLEFFYRSSIKISKGKHFDCQNCKSQIYNILEFFESKVHKEKLSEQFLSSLQRNLQTQIEACKMQDLQQVLKSFKFEIQSFCTEKAAIIGCSKCMDRRRPYECKQNNSLKTQDTPIDHEKQKYILKSALERQRKQKQRLFTELGQWQYKSKQLSASKKIIQEQNEKLQQQNSKLKQENTRLRSRYLNKGQIKKESSIKNSHKTSKGEHQSLQTSENKISNLEFLNYNYISQIQNQVFTQTKLKINESHLKQIQSKDSVFQKLNQNKELLTQTKPEPKLKFFQKSQIVHFLAKQYQMEHTKLQEVIISNIQKEIQTQIEFAKKLFDSVSTVKLTAGIYQGKKNILLVARTLTNRMILAFTTQSLGLKSESYRDYSHVKAFLFSYDEKKEYLFRAEQINSVRYDENQLIYGNQQLRINFRDSTLHLNLNQKSGKFKGLAKISSEQFLDSNKPFIELQSFQIYEISFKNSFECSNPVAISSFSDNDVVKLNEQVSSLKQQAQIDKQSRLEYQKQMKSWKQIDKDNKSLIQDFEYKLTKMAEQKVRLFHQVQSLKESYQRQKISKESSHQQITIAHDKIKLFQKKENAFISKSNELQNSIEEHNSKIIQLQALNKGSQLTNQFLQDQNSKLKNQIKQLQEANIILLQKKQTMEIFTQAEKIQLIEKATQMQQPQRQSSIQFGSFSFESHATSDPAQKLKDIQFLLKTLADAKDIQSMQLQFPAKSLENKILRMLQTFAKKQKSALDDLNKQKADKNIISAELKNMKKQVTEVKNAIAKTQANQNSLLQKSIKPLKKQILDLQAEKEQLNALMKSNLQLISKYRTADQKFKVCSYKNPFIQYEFDCMFMGDILEPENKQPLHQEKQFLARSIEKLMKQRVKKTRIIYKHDPLNRASFHSYVDNKMRLLFIIVTVTGSIIAGYYNGSLTDKSEMKELGLMTELTSKSCYFKKDRESKSMTYDKYWMIFGNAEVRFNPNETSVYSNFAIQNGYFQPGQDKVDKILKKGEQRSVDYVHYEFHQVFFQDTATPSQNQTKS